MNRPIPSAALSSVAPAPAASTGPARPFGSAAREFFIDWLRIVALGLLILYHVGMAYVSWGWHVKSAVTTPAVAALVEPWMRLSAPWRMTLLFVVSGLATSLLLRRRSEAHGSGGRGWLGQRARRLLLPLATGMVLIVPVQSYFELRQYHGFAGNLLEFLRIYFGGSSGLCTPQRGCLVLPTWNHLWFLPYLFLYTALVALVQRRWPAALERAAARLPVWLAGAGLLLWPLAWFALTRATLRPLFGETHAFVDDVFLHAQYAAAFALGVLLARPAAAPLWPRLQQLRHPALALTLAAWALIVATPPGPAWRALPWSVMQWCAVVAALGYAQRHWQRDGAARRVLSAAVFPVYLFHQTVTVAAVAWLAPWRLPVAAEAALVVALTFGLSWAGYEIVRRVARRLPALGPWFGLGDGPARSRRHEEDREEGAADRPAGHGDEMRVIASRLRT